MNYKLTTVLAALFSTCAFTRCAAGVPACCTPEPVESGQSSSQIGLHPGLGHLHHLVSTQNALAQRVFDQGLTLVYAFDMPHAYQSFQRAAALDPHLAMADWGMALASGTSYNQPGDADHEQRPVQAITKAQALERWADAEDRSLIEALATRYSVAPRTDFRALDAAYAQAMRRVYTEYSNDPDVGALYAESLMDLHPWQLWQHDGMPTAGTPEILRVLQAVMQKYPDHLGANHYYIHAVEASPHPEWGMASADRLPSLAPAAEHIVHMPAHIYMRVGDYEAASTSNEAAIRADGAWSGEYGLHDMNFLRAARCMEGDYAKAKDAAERMVRLGGISGDDALYNDAPLLVMTRFAKWNDVESVPAPSSRLPLSRALWNYAQGMAAAATGRTDAASGYAQKIAAAAASTDADLSLDLASARSILQIAHDTLAGKIAEERGAPDAAVALFTRAVAEQDALSYDEPTDWYYPIRESLGGAELMAGNATQAESIFQADLRLNPNNGRSLFGLTESLRRQGKITEADATQRQYHAAWSRADTTLAVKDL